MAHATKPIACRGCERIAAHEHRLELSSRITDEGRTWGLMSLGEMRREHEAEPCPNRGGAS